MGISESLMKNTLTCVESICDDVDCEIESACCKTHYTNSPKRSNSKDSMTSYKSEMSYKSEISDK